jgi:hypothetical protein
LRESTLSNYRNPLAAFNSTFSEAVTVVNHLREAGPWMRWRSGYRIPEFLSAQVIPQLPVGEGMEALDPEAFGPRGYLNDERLNHHVVLGYAGTAALRIPVGYLTHYFLIGPLEGYREVARLLKEFRLPVGAPPPAAGADESDPEEGPVS